MKKFCIELGDPSCDGHGISRDIFVQSNIELKALEKAYKDSVKTTGIDFKKICSNYDDNSLPSDIYEKFVKLGCPFEDMGFESPEDRDLYLDGDSFVSLFMWFIGLSVKEKFEWKIVEDDCPHFSKSFGYGLYSN